MSGKCIEYYNRVEMFLVSACSYTDTGKWFYTSVRTAGTFEFKIGDEAGDIMIISPVVIPYGSLSYHQVLSRLI